LNSLRFHGRGDPLELPDALGYRTVLIPAIVGMQEIDFDCKKPFVS